jgi:hypothetical protein
MDGAILDWIDHRDLDRGQLLGLLLGTLFGALMAAGVQLPLRRELDGDDVAVLHHVVAALEAQRAAIARAA